jgi:uncharacterized membrane protein YqjE
MNTFLTYLPIALIGTQCAGMVYTLCVKDDDPQKRLVSLFVIVLYVLALYGLIWSR